MNLADLLKQLDSQKDAPAPHGEDHPSGDPEVAPNGSPKPRKKKEILDQAGVDALLASLFEK